MRSLAVRKFYGKDVAGLKRTDGRLSHESVKSLLGDKRRIAGQRPLIRGDVEDAVFEHRFPAYTGDVHKAVESYLTEAGQFNQEDAKIVWDQYGITLRKLGSAEDSEEIKAKDNLKIKEIIVDSYHYDRLIDYVRSARKYNEKINAASDEDLLSLYNEMQRKEEIQQQDRSRQRDLYAFHNLDASRADVPFWSSLRSWTAEQAVALSFGKDPRKVNPDSLKPYRKVARSLFSELFEDRLILMEGAIVRGDLKLPLDPLLVIDWAIAEKTRFSGSFSEFKSDLLFEEKKSKDLGQQKLLDFALNTRSAQTLYSCLMLLLLEHYNYDCRVDLKAEQGDTFIRLVNDLEGFGLPVTAKPLREHVAAARTWAFKRESFLTKRELKRRAGTPSE